MIVLKSIEEEAADCRERCKDMRIGDMVLHCHHEVLCERLTEPVENRIAYILAEKTDNVALRLRMLGPLLTDAETQADEQRKTAYARHYARLFPDSPWNGKTIFAAEFTLPGDEEKA